MPTTDAPDDAGVDATRSPLRLYTFSAAWGLPTAGPFGLKLEACFRMLGVPYQRVFENNVRKGPKRKSPWIEDGALRLGDSELILDHVARTRGKRLDEDLTTVERARSHALRRMIEEHFHQVFEYELILLDAGFAQMKAFMAGQIPGLLRPLILPLARRSFRHHLFERGIARHGPAEVEAMGRADVDALAGWLGDREWFICDRPTKADASAFGLLAVAIRSSLDTPVCRHARAQPNLVAFVDRMLTRLFAEQATNRPAVAA
jgi:glutathione S-transferase